jgi:D-amino-acid dehydrogenase
MPELPVPMIANSMQRSTEKLVIVGGGVIGLSAAYYALKEGYQVTVLDRSGPQQDSCSSANAGMIVPSHFTPLAAPGVIGKGLRWMLDKESPFYIRPRLSLQLARWGWLFCQHANQTHVEAVREVLCELNLESRRLFQELSCEDDFGLQSRGLLMLCQSQKTLDEEAEVARQARKLGLKAELLDATSAAKLDPNIEMSIAGAVHFAEDCHLDPARFLVSLGRRIAQMGGKIIHNCPIDSITFRDGKVGAVSGPAGAFEANHFVISGGSWSPDLLRQIGLRLPMQSGKGYSLTLTHPVQLPQLCSILTEAKVAVTPMGNSLRFAGTMEIGGLNTDIDPARVRGIVKAATRYFPNFKINDFDGLKAWVGLRPVSPDGMPYLGKVPDLDNLVVATGHAMMGLSLAPVTGKLITEILKNQPTSIPLKALAPNRFS